MTITNISSIKICKKKYKKKEKKEKKTFQSFDCERTLRRYTPEMVVGTKLYIYVFITNTGSINKYHIYLIPQVIFNPRFSELNG